MIRTNLVLVLSLSLLCPALTACSGDDAATEGSSDTGSTSGGDSDTDATGMNSTSTTGETTGEATTGEATTGEATTGEATTGEATTGEATTGEATTGEATTGEVTGGDEVTESCEAGCDVYFECFPDEYESIDECIVDCVESTVQREPNCEAALVAWNNCIATLECAEIDDENACPEELEVLIQHCEF